MPGADEDGEGPTAKRPRKSKWDPDEAAAAGAVGSSATASSALAAATGFPGTPSITSWLSSRLAPGSGDGARIYVGNLGPWLGEAEVRQIFSAIGLVVAVDMPKEGSPPRSKGFCFVEMTDAATAKRAVEAMHEFTVAGQRLKVSFPSRPRGVISGIPPPPTPLSPATLATLGGCPGVPGPLLIGSTASAPTSSNNKERVAVPAAVAAASAAEGNTAMLKERRRLAVTGLPREFRDKEFRSLFATFGMIASCELIPCIENPSIHCGAGIVEFVTENSAKEAMSVMLGFDLGNGATLTVRPLGPGGREALISAWASEEAPSLAPAAPAAAAAPPVEPSPILALENLVAPGEVDEDLKQEVKEECGKFGKIQKVKIHEGKEPARVRVFVQFLTKEATASATKALHGRWFGGRQVRAFPYNIEAFDDGDLEWDPPASA